jgi:hypothetical protein
MEWIRSDDLVALGWASDATIYRKTRDGEWLSRSSGSSGKRGRPAKEILVSSLPPELQAKLAARAAAELEGDGGDGEPAGGSEIGNLKSQSDQVPQTETEKSDARLNALSNALGRYPIQERDAWMNEVARLAQIVIEFDSIKPKRVRVYEDCGENHSTQKIYFEKGSKKKGRKGKKHAGSVRSQGKLVVVKAVTMLCKRAALSDAVNPGAASILKREPTRAREVSVRTLDRWSAAYKKYGLVTFIRDRAIPAAGDKRLAKVTPEAIIWVNRVWRNYASPKAIYDAAVEKGMKERPRWVLPSKTWFYRHGWQKIPPMLATYLKAGDKGFVGKWESHIERDFSDLGAFELLCGDHRVSDVSVLWLDGRAVRIWTTLWQCLRTGLIAGRHFALKPSSVTAGYAYANMVKTWGAQPPAGYLREGYRSGLYTDRGKDYLSKNWHGQVIEVFKEAMNIKGDLEMIVIERRIGFVEEMRLAHYVARGYNGKEKPVERTNRDLAEFERNHPAFKASYCGRDAKYKPDEWVKNWGLHEKFLKCKRSASPFINFEDYTREIDAWIARYNTSVHTRITLGNRRIVPMEEFHKLYTTRFEISDTAMSRLLMKGDSKLIGKNGVGIDGTPWHYLDRKGLMKRYAGSYVETRWYDSDMSKVWVFLPDGERVEAEVLEKSTFYKLNKETAERISKQKKIDRRLLKEHSYLTQSIIRGESSEDRAAISQQEEYELEVVERPIAVGESSTQDACAPRVRVLTRMDRAGIAASKPRGISRADIASARVDSSIFVDDRDDRDSGELADEFASDEPMFGELGD